MTALPLFITADRVADLLGLDSARAFLRQRQRLEEERLFPPPVGLQRKTLRWQTAAVLAWADRQGQAPAPMPARNVVQLRAV